MLHYILELDNFLYETFGPPVIFLYIIWGYVATGFICLGILNLKNYITRKYYEYK